MDCSTFDAGHQRDLSPIGHSLHWLSTSRCGSPLWSQLVCLNQSRSMCMNTLNGSSSSSVGERAAQRKSSLLVEGQRRMALAAGLQLQLAQAVSSGAGYQGLMSALAMPRPRASGSTQTRLSSAQSPCRTKAPVAIAWPLSLARRGTGRPRPAALPGRAGGWSLAGTGGPIRRPHARAALPRPVRWVFYSDLHAGRVGVD